jgi:hypothetical protein
MRTYVRSIPQTERTWCPQRVGTVSGGWENSGANSLNRRFEFEARRALYAKWNLGRMRDWSKSQL